MFPAVPGEPQLSPQDEDYITIDISAGANRVGMQGQGRRVVSEMEWNMLNEEIRRARSRLGRSCQLCSSYQSQLQKVSEVEKAFGLGREQHYQIVALRPLNFICHRSIVIDIQLKFELKTCGLGRE